MKRKLIGKLLKVKEEEGLNFTKKPTIIIGAKQVGKTYAVREFANLCNLKLLYIDFNQVVDTESLNKEDTLIFIDNIHNYEESISMINILCKDGFIVFGASDSLDKDNLKDISNARIETLYTMDFEEYLWSRGKTYLAELITEHFKRIEPLEEVYHLEALEEFDNYMLTGGMPTVLCAHLYHKNPEKEHEYKELIGDSYIIEMTEGLSNPSSLKVKEVYSSIPEQLIKENKKFQYKHIREGGRATFYESIIKHMSEKGTILTSNKISDKGSFKLYLNDTGILAWRLKLNNDNFKKNENKKKLEALYENYVAIQISASGYKLNYWESRGTAGVDFVLDVNGIAVPVAMEIESNKKSKNLKVYEENFKPSYTIKISRENFGETKNCRSIPMYSIFNL